MSSIHKSILPSDVEIPDIPLGEEGRQTPINKKNLTGDFNADEKMSNINKQGLTDEQFPRKPRRNPFAGFPSFTTSRLVLTSGMMRKKTIILRENALSDFRNFLLEVDGPEIITVYYRRIPYTAKITKISNDSYSFEWNKTLSKPLSKYFEFRDRRMSINFEYNAELGILTLNDFEVD